MNLYIYTIIILSIYSILITILNFKYSSLTKKILNNWNKTIEDNLKLMIQEILSKRLILKNRKEIARLKSDLIKNKYR